MDNSLKVWKTRIREAKEFRRIYGRDRDWRRFRSYYRHNWETTSGDGYLPLNITYAMAKALLPQVYPKTPAVRVTATKPEFEPHATILEALDNWLLRRLDFSGAIRKASLSAYLYGTGVIKFGYDREFGTESEKTLNEPFGGRVTKGGTLLEFNKLTPPGMPWILPNHPGNFLVPWATTDLRNAPWCAFRIVRSVEAVKKDKMYSNLSNLKPTWATGAPVGWREADRDRSPEPMYDSPEGSLSRPESEQFIELWEIHDLASGYIRVLSMDNDGWLRNEPNILLLDGLPADSVIFNDDDESFWGTSDVALIEPQQLEMNDILTQWQKIRRTAVIKFIVDGDNVDPDECEKLLDETVRNYITARGDINKVVKEFKPSVGAELLQAAQFVWQNVREVIGFSRNQLGEFDDSSRRTATEAGIVKNAHDLRMSDRRNVTSNVIINAVHKMNQLVFNFWDTNQAAKIVGPDGLQYWVQFTGEQLAGEFNYKVDLDAEVPQTKDVRKAEAMMALQAFRNDPDVDQLELKRWVLSQAEGAPLERLLAPGVARRQNFGMAQGQGGPMAFNEFASKTQGNSGMANALSIASQSVPPGSIPPEGAKSR